MNLLFCPGYHDPALSRQFIAALHLPPAIALYLYPAPDLPPYSPHHILQFLDAQNIHPEQQFIIMGFSAGVVGAIATAHIWQRSRGKISALIALDGWGVPLFADFPIYRLSHDRFTHDTSRLLGRGNLDFYADPPVEHLALLRSPHQVAGWSESPDGSEPRQFITAQDFLYNIIINNINESC